MNVFKVTFQFRHNGEWVDDYFSNCGQGFSYKDALDIVTDLRSHGADGLPCRNVQIQRLSYSENQ